ncbi:MAG TPA: MSMEG_4193 family putative phosphomutase [Actinomycetota bacterium]|jgi:probable phosphomutase (TIGR03848 family)|nr:MSMEG_4193 family putative phosphomutase [Actinomycetota bacterium]
MGLVFLVRHGLTGQTGRLLYGRTPGIDLDARGRAQADALVQRFDAVRLSAIYSSPLERCRQTVEPLAAARRLQMRTDDAFLEMEAGDWTGRTLAQLRRTKAWRVVQQTPSDFVFPGGEAFMDAQARVVTAIDRLARRHRRGSIVIATHGDIVRIALAHYLATPLDDFQRIVIDTVGVSVILLGGARPHVLLVNDTGGLSRFRAEHTAPWEASRSPDRRGGAKVKG